MSETFELFMLGGATEKRYRGHLLDFWPWVQQLTHEHLYVVALRAVRDLSYIVRSDTEGRRRGVGGEAPQGSRGVGGEAPQSSRAG